MHARTTLEGVYEAFYVGSFFFSSDVGITMTSNTNPTLTFFVQGDIDNIAPLITSFFCMSYALCNLTAFALSVTGAPNFRPTWKYYSWQLALLGFIMNIGT